jgi:hypothetical protein
MQYFEKEFLKKSQIERPILKKSKVDVFMGSALLKRNILGELLTTEETYNANLKKVTEVVIDPLLERINKKTLCFVDGSFLVIFEKLKAIIEQSAMFLTSLNAFDMETAAGATCLIIFADFETVADAHLGYIEKFHDLSALLLRERNRNGHFERFLVEKEESLGDTFQSFLIQPIQRPPRYRLLIESLLKCGSDELHQSEREGLAAILTRLCNKLSHMDEMMTHMDSYIKKMELQSILEDFHVMKPGRHLYYRCALRKFSRKTTQERYCVVFSDVLFIGESTLMNLCKTNKVYQSNEYLIQSVDDRPPFINAIDIRQPKKSFRANCPSAEVKRQLLEAFEKVLQFAKISRYSLEMRGFAPVWIPDDQAPQCMCCDRKFTVIHRRHHCRACGDCICGKCFSHKIECPWLQGYEQQVCTKCYEKIQTYRRIRNRAGPNSASVLVLPSSNWN